MNDLIRPALYGSYQAIQPVVQSKALRRSSRTSSVRSARAGTSSPRTARLRGRERGDLLAVMSAGAYGFTMASNYNSHPKPPEMLVDGDKYYVIRARENFDDLIRGEVIPAALQ